MLKADEADKEATASRGGIKTTQNVRLWRLILEKDQIGRLKFVLQNKLGQVVKWALGCRFQGHHKHDTQKCPACPSATITTEHILSCEYFDNAFREVEKTHKLDGLKSNLKSFRMPTDTIHLRTDKYAEWVKSLVAAEIELSKIINGLLKN